MMYNRYLIWMGILFLCTLHACHEKDTTLNAPSTMKQQYQIVGGSLETGFDAVGALLGYNASTNRVSQSFCTGTLIDEEWVLTAAHCVVDDHSVRTPNSILFYIGTDFSQSINQGNYPDDTFTGVSQIIVHPDYDADLLIADIALLRLDTIVNRPVIPIYRRSITQLQNQSLYYVGFGASQVQPLSGSGIKRSTQVDVAYIIDQVYVTSDESTVCFGDSGGPGLYDDQGVWKVVGVNSAVANDLCNDFSIHMRTDVFARWIDQSLGRTPLSCQQDPQVCACDQACQAQGTCDDTVCGTEECNVLYDCINACDEYYCAEDCKRIATPVAVDLLENIYQCFEEECSTVVGADFQECVLNACGNEINSCLAVFGTESCRDINSCINQCPNQVCVQSCYQSGDQQAQTLLSAWYDCSNEYCANVSENEYGNCIAQYCATQYESCIDPSDCNLLGGDCPNGQACQPLVTGTGDCADSRNIMVGGRCNLMSDTYQCTDGMSCIQLEGDFSAICTERCDDDAQCSTGYVCGDVGINDYHLCVPGDTTTCVEEMCDGIDNDCDMMVDEGCMTDPIAGSMAGMDAGEMAGTDAGEMAGMEVEAGIGAGEEAGISAGEESDIEVGATTAGETNEVSGGTMVVNHTEMVTLVNDTNETNSSMNTKDQGCVQSVFTQNYQRSLIDLIVFIGLISLLNLKRRRYS